MIDWAPNLLIASFSTLLVWTLRDTRQKTNWWWLLVMFLSSLAFCCIYDLVFGV